MTQDVTLRIQGHSARITLNRPTALNALTLDMCHAIDRALDTWANDPAVTLLIIDGAGDKAFCAGGDIQDIYTAGQSGDYSFGETFWRAEYRMIAKLFNFPKPVVTFLHGFTMGGGVGVGCHGSHRIVCENSILSLPETSIGLIPDVGSTLILGQAPGRLGEYLGLTGDRMQAADAIHAGFADYFIPQNVWPALIETLCATGNWEVVDATAVPPPESPLAKAQPVLDSVFGGETLGDIWRGMPDTLPDPLVHAQKLLTHNSPLAMISALGLIRKMRERPVIEDALMHEFRFVSRAMEHGDFLEGIRASVIDRDRTPKWRNASWQDVPGGDVVRMLYPVKPPLDLTGPAP